MGYGNAGKSLMWYPAGPGCWERTDVLALGRVWRSGNWQVFILNHDSPTRIVAHGHQDSVVSASIAADLAMAKVNEKRKEAA